jgi:hypothetical protein
MVIHDLKHPTESMMSQLQIMDERLTVANKEIVSTISDCRAVQDNIKFLRFKNRVPQTRIYKSSLSSKK